MRMKWLPGLLLLLSAVTQSQAAPDAATPADVQTLVATQASATAARAELLAPEAFGKAQAALRDYQKAIASGAKPEKLQKRQVEAQQSLDKVTATLALSNKTLQTVIKAYDDALVAHADQSQPESWSKAQHRFQQAIAEVEDNSLDAARKKGAEAEVLLRDVELAAIKDKVLGEARQWLTKSRDGKWADLAPRSTAQAGKTLEAAGLQLDRNRYDLATAQALAAQAVYEAKHAQMLYELIAAAKSGEKTSAAEAQWLALEKPIRELLAAMNVNAVFDGSYPEAINAASEQVNQQQRALLDAQNDNTNLKDQLRDANATLRQLQQRLGGESEERQALQKKLITQERLRDAISKVEDMFTPQEGRVYRQNGDLILSLTGIGFRSGKSTIEPDSFPLLAKLGDAVRLFPNATVSVEGHTDNQGSDSANLLLSQDRADAVRQYLITNLGVDAEKISSIGYGKSRPVTSNDTETGRARNRRIDVVMKIEGL